MRLCTTHESIMDSTIQSWFGINRRDETRLRELKSGEWGTAEHDREYLYSHAAQMGVSKRQ